MFASADQQDQEDWWHSLKEKETKESKHTKGTQKAAEAKNLQCHTCTNETWTWVDIYLFNATAYNCRVLVDLCPLHLFETFESSDTFTGYDLH